jgi:phospholipid transport system substrate-binding protein
MMKLLKQLLLIATLSVLAGVARADATAPDALIKNTVDDIIGIIKKDKEIQAGDQKKIIALVDSKVLPHFDFERMTRLAAGKYWRTATPEQKQQLVTEFRNMLVRTYTKVFTVYRNQTVEMKPFKMDPGDTEVTVKTAINNTDSGPITVDYEMEKMANDWKVFDISISGVSMVMSYRGTFASEIEQGGIDHLIKSLANKNLTASNEDSAKTRTK